jgi:hypothetical protein
MDFMSEDPEISAMAAIKAALDNLDEGTRDRVLRWARDRWGKTVARSEVVPAQPSTPSRVPILPQGQMTNQFTDVASVYEVANPGSDTDKVLVVGYWFQVVRGDSELDSQSINSELKNLGYPVSNVTRAVSKLASTTPRYVLQTKKSGVTQQARKKFRLTVEGIKRVEQMLGGAALAPIAVNAGDDVTDEDE